MKPGNIRDLYFEKYLHILVLNLTVYAINIIFFPIIRKKPGEVPIFTSFLAKYSILAHISLKSPNWAKLATMTSL